MLHLILGRAGSGKTGEIYTAIRQRIEGKQPGAILLVPEQYSHAAERELIARCGAEASLYAEVLSFTRLASRVADELGLGRAPLLDEGGRILTMRMALESVSDVLRIYGAMSRKPEFLQGLLDTIDELKQCALTPEALTDAVDFESGSLSDKLHDLAYIQAAYDKISKRSDPRDVLTRLADTMSDSRVVQSTVFVDAFSDFTAQEMRVLKGFLAAGTDLTVALTCDGVALAGNRTAWTSNDGVGANCVRPPYSTNAQKGAGEHSSPLQGHALFAPAIETAGHLTRIAKEHMQAVEVQTLTPRDDRPEELVIIEQYLFSRTLPDVTDISPGAVELYTAQTPMDECMLAAARVRALVMDEGYRYRDIAVAARGFADYEAMAEHVFARYDIPIHLARKTSILDKPILLLLTSALDILDSGWRFEPVFRYLRTGLAGITQEELDCLEGYVQTWNIFGNTWTRQADWTENPAGYGAPFGDAERAELAVINALRRRVMTPLKALADAGRQAKTAAEQGEALYGFLETIALPETLAEKSRRLHESGRETLAAEYSQIWDILVGALEQAHTILGDTPMDQKEFSALIRLTLSGYSVGAIPQTLDRVHLGELDRTRRRDLKCLIVLGATDERLPAPNAGRGVFTEDERLRLGQIGLTLSGNAVESVHREEAMTYHAFAAPKERLLVSWPKVEDDGRACRKSALLSRMERLLGREAVPTWTQDARLFINAPDPAFDLSLRTDDPSDSLAQQARAYFAADARFLAVSACIHRASASLSETTTASLYGEKLRLSASRVESFGACRFRYFMEYGLQAKARKRADLDASMAGDFMHYILEHVTREIKDGGGFHAPIADEWRALTDRWVAEYTKLHLGEMADKTSRFHYLFRRLRRDTYQVVEDMVSELRRSDFVPLDFELTFGDGATLPAVELSTADIELRLRGAVDRVDGWVQDDTLYLRVVDYKTGRKKFSFSDVWYGMGMQMLLYLGALVRLGSTHYGGAKLAPAGVLYTPARDVIVSVPKHASVEEIEKARRRELVRSGVIVDDPDLVEAMERGEKHFIPVKWNKEGELVGESLVTAEDLGRLSRHIDRTLLALAGEIRRGSVSALPQSGSGGSPCAYCDYRMACHYDPETDGSHYLEPLSKDTVLEELREVDADDTEI